MATLEETVARMKNRFESAIRRGEHSSLIRSSTLIECLHLFIKEKLIESNIDESRIHIKDKAAEKQELQLHGHIKPKNQDICILPEEVEYKPEPITWGELKEEGVYDPLGIELTEKIITINIRSQLSSLLKNKDTLFERTFAESLNLHLRCPKMCLGEVYLIPAYEYDDEERPCRGI